MSNGRWPLYGRIGQALKPRISSRISLSIMAFRRLRLNRSNKLEVSLHVSVVLEVGLCPVSRSSSHSLATSGIFDHFRHGGGQTARGPRWYYKTALSRGQHSRRTPGCRNPREPASHCFQERQRCSLVVRGKDECVRFPQGTANVPLRADERDAIRNTQSPPSLPCRNPLTTIANHNQPHA